MHRRKKLSVHNPLGNFTELDPVPRLVQVLVENNLGFSLQTNSVHTWISCTPNDSETTTSRTCLKNPSSMGTSDATTPRNSSNINGNNNNMID